MGARENRRQDGLGGGGYKSENFFPFFFVHVFFSSFLIESLFSLSEPFTTINSASHLFNFQYSDQTIFLRQTSRVDHHTRPNLHNSQSDPPQIRPSYPSTTPDHPQTRQPSDHQIRPSPPYQTNRSDHPNRQPLTSFLEWYRLGAFLMVWVKGGI